VEKHSKKSKHPAYNPFQQVDLETQMNLEMLAHICAANKLGTSQA
jgi:hypothetical protein